jgi:dihydropteroate synthase
MAIYNLQFVNVNSLQDAREEIHKIGSDSQSIEIMAPKAVFKVIKLTNVVLQDAIIIKQDMLSLGGEVAVPKNTFELYNTRGDILIMGTLKQLGELTNKLDRHYQRLKDVAKGLSILLKDIK